MGRYHTRKLSEGTRGKLPKLMLTPAQRDCLALADAFWFSVVYDTLNKKGRRLLHAQGNAPFLRMEIPIVAGRKWL